MNNEIQFPSFNDLVSEVKGYEKNLTKKSSSSPSPSSPSKSKTNRNNSTSKIQIYKMHFVDVAYDDLIYEIYRAERVIAATHFDANMMKRPVQDKKVNSVQPLDLDLAVERIRKAKQGDRAQDIKLELPDNDDDVRRLLVRPALSDEDNSKFVNNIVHAIPKIQISNLNELDDPKFTDQFLIDYAREYYKKLYDSFSMNSIPPREFRVMIKRNIAVKSGISRDLINSKFGESNKKDNV